MRGGDEHRRVALFQDRLGTRLVLGTGIAVEEQNGAGLDPELLKLLTKRKDLVLVERLLDLAVREHALLHLEAQRPLDQRHMFARSEEHTSELQSRENLVCRLLLEKKKKK